MFAHPACTRSLHPTTILHVPIYSPVYLSTYYPSILSIHPSHTLQSTFSVLTLSFLILSIIGTTTMTSEF